MEKCYRCGGELKPRKVTIEESVQGYRVIARSVPALVCVECGERVIKGSVLESLESFVASELKKRTERTSPLEPPPGAFQLTLNVKKGKGYVLV